jgi:2-keto-4-pentenoate hydratase/2-oxohepta-3-ene-1,7-dioic acid hydratase in catechol pathway
VIDIPAALGASDATSTMLGIIRAARPCSSACVAWKIPAPRIARRCEAARADPAPHEERLLRGWNTPFRGGRKKLQDDRKLPEWPVFFSKVPGAVTGPYDTVPFHSHVSTQCDWEVELGVIIGPGGKDITQDTAMKHVWGYTVINDVSWRDIQRRHGGQWHKGKSLDGSCPMGPWIVTADEVDHANLAVACRVNGVTEAGVNTKHMYFKVPRLIADLSAGMTLEPGDIISTGTPEGVGFARTPPEFMKPGDLLETEIQGIGVLRNPIG